MKESVVEINSSESDLDEDKNLPRSRSRSRFQATCFKLEAIELKSNFATIVSEKKRSFTRCNPVGSEFITSNFSLS
ncbi:CMF_collapsed_G0013390.mRNA.1.CDS.1 [Saccharomyces cerevisiae]|nr:CMF_collapsed_G0013390.mRNA.1.CDS.1 [Saccharomyces cerevisiae]